MITINITSYRGQDAEASHYYATFYEISNVVPPHHYNGPRGSSNEIRHELTQIQADALSRKDKMRWHEGDKTSRFDSIEEINQEILKQFPNNDIITYYEGNLFHGSLYIKDGKQLGIETLGEIWSNVPNSCFTDLIKGEVKIKCHMCGKEWKLNEVTEEGEHFGRPLTKFIRKRDMWEHDPCCEYFDLEWNVIL